MKGPLRQIGKYIGTGLGVLGLAGALYATDLPKAEQLKGFKIYLAEPIIGLEFDTDGDEVGDHVYEYKLGNMNERETTLLFYKDPNYPIYRYAIDENRNGLYDKDEWKFPREEPKATPQKTNGLKRIVKE